MGSTLVLTGQRYNVLETGTVTVSTEDSLYPATRLYDGRPIQPFKFSSTADQTIDIDGNRITNGNLDTWSGGAPSGWTVDGTVAETTTAGEFRSGSAARVDSNGSITMTFWARSGERIVINGWRRILAAGQGVAQAFLRNVNTGRQWDGSSWVSGVFAGPFLEDSTNTAYTEYGPTAVTVEAYSVTKTDLCQMELQLVNGDLTGGDYVFFDDWFVWPSIDFLSIHGHNIISSVSVALRRGSTFPAGSLEVTLTLDSPSFYTYRSTVRDDRYWRIIVSGDNLTAPYLGEVVLGRALALARKPDLGGVTLAERSEAIVATSEYGERHAVQRMTANRRRLAMGFRFATEATYTEARDEVNRRSGGVPSSYPFVIVPDSNRAEVLHGALVGGEWGVRRLTTDYFSDNDILVEENAFPLLTS